MSDLISRADAIEAIQNAYCKPCKERGDDHNEVRCRACNFDDAIIQIDALPSAETSQNLAEPNNGLKGSDFISRADAMGAVQDHFNANGFKGYDDGQKMMDRIKALPSANIIEFDFNKHQPRVRNKVHDALPAEAEYTDLPDIPRYYYEKVVGKMSHEINILKEQLESAEAVQGEWILHDGYYCSNCHYKLQTTGIPQYCPSCGARMKGGAE